MKRSVIVGTVLCLLAGVAASSAFAQEKKKAEKKAPTQEEMMKQWQESMTPGDAHKKLEAMVGTWDAEVKMWMNGPNGEPTISKGTSENKLVLGGRYVQQDFTGDMMSQPFIRIGYTGYDIFRKKYTGFWINNMITAMSTMDGSLDKAGTVITTWGKMGEPIRS